MAFPIVETNATTAGALNSSYALTMPSGIIARELLVAWVAGSSITGDAMTGWTKVGTAANGNSNIVVYAKQAVGGDTGTVTGTFTARLGQACRISGSDATPANVGFAAVSTNSVNPPNLNMSLARDYLWLAFARNDGNAITAPPTNYTTVATNAFGTTTWLSTARRALYVAAEDPGIFTITSNSLSVAGVIAVRPSPASFFPFF